MDIWLKALEGACGHLDLIKAVAAPKSAGCVECMEAGDDWKDLRFCLTCGYVGCCDASRNRHANEHFRLTGHPLIGSREPGENWAWCYVDRTFLTLDSFKTTAQG